MASTQDQHSNSVPRGVQDDGDSLVETLTAAMPPRMQHHQRLSADEILREMNRVPLFMSSLDDPSSDPDGAPDENPMLEAIRAIAYEGTYAEVSTNFREQGNEAARARRWPDAREFYSKAIAAARGEVGTTGSAEAPPLVVDEEAELRVRRQVEEACLANRALCNLELKNYGSCTRDCASALGLNPRNVKAWYRAALARLALDKPAEALEACERGLACEAGNASLQAVQKRAEKRKAELVAREEARNARKAEEAKRAGVLAAALAKRGIVRASNNRDGDERPDLEDAVVGLEDPGDAESALYVPVLFLYPLDAESDLVKRCGEEETLGEHLAYVLPPPWDSERGEYAAAQEVDCFLETGDGGLVKAGKKLALKKLLGNGGGGQIIDGLVRVYVVPRARVGEWIERFKERRGKAR